MYCKDKNKSYLHSRCSPKSSQGKININIIRCPPRSPTTFVSNILSYRARFYSRCFQVKRARCILPINIIYWTIAYKLPVFFLYLSVFTKYLLVALRASHLMHTLSISDKLNLIQARMNANRVKYYSQNQFTVGNSTQLLHCVKFRLLNRATLTRYLAARSCLTFSTRYLAFPDIGPPSYLYCSFDEK